MEGSDPFELMLNIDIVLTVVLLLIA